MTVVVTFIRLFARIFEGLGGIFSRIGSFFNALLPAMLHPNQLSALVHRYYEAAYDFEHPSSNGNAPHLVGFNLERWEAQVWDRHGIPSGRVLVLGCGYGRESIALAARNRSIIALDRHRGVLGRARRLAQEAGANVRFVQADFLDLPHTRESFDCVLLSSTMYSAIPGLQQRQAWLRCLRRLVKPKGRVILSFQSTAWLNLPTNGFSSRLNRWLCRLPGGNREFQDGDVFYGTHFFHVFRGDKEIRAELDGAGVIVHELDAAQQYAVIGYPV